MAASMDSHDSGSSPPASAPEPPPSDAAGPSRRSSPLLWVRDRLEAVHGWMESVGVSSNALDFLLAWWRKLGTAGAIAVVLAVVLPAGGYASLAYSTSRSIPGWIGDFGVRFEAEDWDIQVLSLKSVARSVTLRRDERSEPVLTAAEIEFDGSLWSVLSTLWGGGRYNEITVRHAEVLVERSLTGDYNWADFLGAVPEARRLAAVTGAYRINGLYFENVRLVFLEHVPGGSGGGVVRSAQSRVIFDGVNGNVLNLRPPAGPDDRPTQFFARARLADGVIEIKGDAGVLPARIARGGLAVRAASVAASPETAGGQVRTVSGADDEVGGYAMRVYLENLSMGAFGEMVGSTQILPSRGTVGGSVELARVRADVLCKSDLTMRDVAFEANARVVASDARYAEMNRTLASYSKASGRFDICGEEATDVTREAAPHQGTMSAVLATFNAQATDTAPPSIRTIAARDQQQFAGVVANALLDDFLRDTQSGGGVTGGLRSVGRGIRRLFGGR
jgi:hypothetical protein